MKRIFFFFAFISFFAMAKAQSHLVYPEIKIGTCNVSLNIDNISGNLTTQKCFIEHSPLLKGSLKFDTIYFEDRNGKLMCQVPMQLTREFVYLNIGETDLEKGKINYLLELVQSQDLDITVDSGQNQPIITTSHPQPFTQEEGIAIRDCTYRFMYKTQTIPYPAQWFDNWKEGRKWELEEQLAPALSQVENDNRIPQFASSWLLNQLKRLYAQTIYIPYVPNVKENTRIKDIKNPPMEAYSWLNELEYGSIFLLRLPDYSLKGFFSHLLRFPDGGFEPIGETKVGEWQQYVRKRIAPAISGPTQLFLNLMATVSYTDQFEREGRPLSEVQINNIREELGRDYLDIILDWQERVASGKEAYQ